MSIMTLSQTSLTKIDSTWCFNGVQLKDIHHRLVERDMYKQLCDSLEKELFISAGMFNDSRDQYDNCIKMNSNLISQRRDAMYIIEEKDKQIKEIDNKLRKTNNMKTLYLILFGITGIIAIVK